MEKKDRDYRISRSLNGEGERKVDWLGTVPGLVLDLIGRRAADGALWDFNDPDMAAEAEKMVDEKRALLLIVSPICAVDELASKLAHLGVTKGELLEHHERHLEWCTKLCNKQRENGLYFMYEHLADSPSWRREAVTSLIVKKKVKSVVAGEISYL